MEEVTAEVSRGQEESITGPATNEALSEYVSSSQEPAPQYTHDGGDTSSVVGSSYASSIGRPSSVTLSLPATVTSTAPSRTPSSSSNKYTIGPIPKLTSPPTLRFEFEPVQWKGLTMDAALWTFDSKELQSIVSRAIRSSALESFIRLLTLESIDKSLPEELTRLESAKIMAQAKYRFLVHRRTMQLQALLSASLSQSNAKDEDGQVANTKLTLQLSETVAECDQIMNDLLHIGDQIRQVQKLIEHHWASALAIALRKLNGSFGRRSEDLKAARERIAQLEAALDEAWGEAERLARDMDKMEAAAEAAADGLSDEEDGDESDHDEAIIETAEKVTMALTHARSSSSPAASESDRNHNSLSIAIPPNDAFEESPHPTQTNGRSPTRSSELSPHASPTAGPSSFKIKSSKANHIPAATPADSNLLPDNGSIKSAKSTRSTKSYRSATHHRELSRTASVSAARTRSTRAAQNSLRLPSSAHRRSASSNSRPRTPYDGDDGEEPLPPVPTMPVHFSNAPFAYGGGIPMNAPSANASSTLLHEGGDQSYSSHMRRSSLDSARGTYGHQTPLPWQASVTSSGAIDDMYLPTKRTPLYTNFPPTPRQLPNLPNQAHVDGQHQRHGSTSMRRSFSMRDAGRGRTPSPASPPKMVPMDLYSAPKSPTKATKERTPFREGGHNSNNGAIPSIWMNADGPKTPPERTNSLTRAGSKGKAAYQRLRTLTKRYSMPFPIFTSKSEGSAGEGTTSRSSGLGRSLTTRTTSRGVFSGSMSDVKEEPEREREALWIKPSTSARSG